MDLTRITSQVNKIKVKNVVDMPLFYGLWMLVLALISSVIQDKDWITIVLFCFAAVMILKAMFGYFYFTFKNPDYLRSEEYHLKKKSLEILGDNDNILPIDAKNIVEITNPYVLNLPEPRNNINNE
jgi:vacuolar-type H+-ATPase subunit I/STV1